MKGVGGNRNAMETTTHSGRRPAAGRGLGSYEDAYLLLKLYELRFQEPLISARIWFERSFDARHAANFDQYWSEDSQGRQYFRMVVSFWEMVASFVTAGILDPELFFQNCGELLYVWEKIRDLVPVTRRSRKNPLSLRNLEMVANAYIAWLDGRAPEAYRALQRRVRQPDVVDEEEEVENVRTA